MVHPRTQTPQGEPVAKPGSALLIILNPVIIWEGLRADYMIRVKSWAGIWKIWMEVELRISFLSHIIYIEALVSLAPELLFMICDKKDDLLPLTQELLFMIYDKKDAVLSMGPGNICDIWQERCSGVSDTRASLTTTWNYLTNHSDMMVHLKLNLSPPHTKISVCCLLLPANRSITS